MSVYLLLLACFLFEPIYTQGFLLPGRLAGIRNINVNRRQSPEYGLVDLESGTLISGNDVVQPGFDPRGGKFHAQAAARYQASLIEKASSTYPNLQANDPRIINFIDNIRANNLNIYIKNVILVENLVHIQLHESDPFDKSFFNHEALGTVGVAGILDLTYLEPDVRYQYENKLVEPGHVSDSFALVQSDIRNRFQEVESIIPSARYAAKANVIYELSQNLVNLLQANHPDLVTQEITADLHAGLTESNVLYQEGLDAVIGAGDIKSIANSGARDVIQGLRQVSIYGNEIANTANSIKRMAKPPEVDMQDFPERRTAYELNAKIVDTKELLQSLLRNQLPGNVEQPITSIEFEAIRNDVNNRDHLFSNPESIVSSMDRIVDAEGAITNGKVIIDSGTTRQDLIIGTKSADLAEGYLKLGKTLIQKSALPICA